MPSTGGTSFLRGGNHFIEVDRDVSMPSTGGTSFLHDETYEEEFLDTLCQCPQRAGPHFYQIDHYPGGVEEIGVSMPSTGGTSFLLNICTERRFAYEHVSMPSTGGTSFLRWQLFD